MLMICPWRPRTIFGKDSCECSGRSTKQDLSKILKNSLTMSKLRNQRSYCVWPFAIVLLTILQFLKVDVMAGSTQSLSGGFIFRATSPKLTSLTSSSRNINKAGAVSSMATLRGGSYKPLSSSLMYYGRVALAGGIAGAAGTSTLYPLDIAKTLRQSDPSKYKSVRTALQDLVRTKSPSGGTQWHVHKAYRGIIPAAVGAIPSSALYFGAYESSKRHLERKLGADTALRRFFVHGLAAASGNTLSSAVFVPKEVIKQQLQCSSASSISEVVWKILQEKGIMGLYTGFGATLMRNIPSAMLRFVLYEECKRVWGYRKGEQVPIGLFVSGAVAGAVASGIMTPVDVVKTRLATGVCQGNVLQCLQQVLQQSGWQGLYAGAGTRILWSGAFAAIGFSTFELAKTAFGVVDSASTQAQTEVYEGVQKHSTSLLERKA
eukprot:Nitzschia sp. Nitz4//scaffold34_size148208//60205//61716//NITZ4_002976-RA/size148208-snap-gene-0.220-mRNA-1//-1//CDS//3329548783//5125//frame0